MTECRTTQRPGSSAVRAAIEVIHRVVNDPDADNVRVDVTDALEVIRLASEVWEPPVSDWITECLDRRHTLAGPLAVRSAVNALAAHFKLPAIPPMTRPAPGQQGQLF